MNRRIHWVSTGLVGVLAGALGGTFAVKKAVPFLTPAIAAAPPVTTEVKPALPPPSPAQVADARSLSRTFAQVASQMSPSVVRITTTKTARGVNMRNMHPFRGTPFERFFRDDGEGGDGPMQGPKQKGLGSGVVISGKGFILTNNHVVEGADEVKVTFVDGKSVNAKVVGADAKSDLAVVKVEPVGELKAAKFGDSDKMQIGEWVVAIGNPLGFDHTVTVGVLSAKNRHGFQASQYEDFLQTDASINPGNSGGPLVNLDGEVIGINTMIAGVGTGIGFAVPATMVKPISEQLISGGKVHRAYLGILLQDITLEMQKTLGRGAPEKGAIVSQITPGAPAEKAGFKVGDIVTAIDGQPTDNSNTVRQTVVGKKIGQKIEVVVWREGKTLKLNPITAELPGEEKRADAATPDTSPKTKLGIVLQALTPEIAQRLGFARSTRGVVVASVRDGGPGDEAGLNEGDVIVEIDRKPVSSVEDANRLLSTPRGGGHMVRLLRGDRALFLVIPE